MKDRVRTRLDRFSRRFIVIATLFAFALAAGGAGAHNLQTKMVYMFFDPNTQACFEARIQNTALPPGCQTLPTVPQGPGDPLLAVGDELGIIVKVIPRDGTDTGVGGHVDFYVPDGTTVLDVGYLLPGNSNLSDGIDGYDKVPMKGQSLIAIGDGPVGGKATAELSGLTSTNCPLGDDTNPACTYTNINSITEDPVVNAGGLHRGTVAGVYGDTGVFFSTDPDTSYGSWARFTGETNDLACGTQGEVPLLVGETITNNSGDTFVPCNKWDAEQMYAWGVKGTSYGGAGSASSPIVDYGDGRGNAPWGFASGVAGPESGYAWHFDWDEWAGSAQDAAAMRAAMDSDEVGPWQRIQYPGSRVSFDQPGLASAELGIASIDAGNLGYPLSPSNPLPDTITQGDTSSPKTIRWAVGQLTTLVPEYVWVKIRVNDTAAILNEDGCPVFFGDTFGGDAGGTDNGKDHLWRYYEPSKVTWDGCMALGKPTDVVAVSPGDLFQYKVKFFNLAIDPITQDPITLTNVVIEDNLPTGVSFVSSFPAQSSGPNPLVWNIPSLQPSEFFEALVTVQATGSGAIENVICARSDQFPDEVCTTEVTPVGSIPILKQDKTASVTSIAPGGSLQYTIEIDNIGSGPSGNPVVIEERLEDGITFKQLESVQVNGADFTGVTGVAAGAEGPIFSVPAAIAPGLMLELTFSVDVSGSAEPGQYCNSFTTYQGALPLTTGSLACIEVGGGKIGGNIFRDWDGQGDKDPGDEGVPVATVELYKCVDDEEPPDGCDPDDFQLVKTTTTDANGDYLFEGLAPLPAAEGGTTYEIRVVDGAGSPLEGYGQTYDPDGDCRSPATVGSDCPAGSNAYQLTLTNEADEDLDNDFGYRPQGNGVIGDTIYQASDLAGTYQEGIDDVTVNLYEDTNGNGVIDVGDQLIATTTTCGDTVACPVGEVEGFYEFTGLAEGLDYLVGVAINDSALNDHFADGWLAVTDNPQQVTGLTGTYEDADIGFFAVTSSTLSGRAYLDEDADNSYDPEVDNPIEGVTVWLCDSSPSLPEVCDSSNYDYVTTTDSSGNYEFALLPGDAFYRVGIDEGDTVHIAGGYGPSTDDQQVYIPLSSNVTDVDFPFTQLLTKAVDKAFASQGETLTYTIQPTYVGSELLSGVTVSDAIPTGTSYAGNDSPVSASEPTIGGTGTITWDLGSNTAAVNGNGGAGASSGQWAANVVAFSSECVNCSGFDSAQALDAPDVTNCGDNANAWTPGDGTVDQEYLWLGYTTPVYATGVRVHEVGERESTVGFVTGVILIEPDGTEHRVYNSVNNIPAGTDAADTLLESPQDDPPNECPGWFELTFPTTPYLVDEVRIETVTPDNGWWENIDAVELLGTENATTTSLTTDRTMVGDNAVFTVTMTLSATAAVTGISATGLTVSGNNNFDASCSGPTPVGDTDISGPGDPVTFTYTCTSDTDGSEGGSAISTLPASLTFTGGATGTGGTFANATSNSVLASPPLTYQVTVDEGTSIITNVAQIYDTTGTVGTVTTPINSNEVVTEVKAGVEGTVFLDWNGNGVVEAGETGFSGLTVELYDGLCVLGGTDPATRCPITTTDAFGNYSFAGLDAGDYTVVVTPPADHEAVSDYDGIATLHTADITVTAGTLLSDVDFGYRPTGTATIGDTVCQSSDADCDDPTDIPMPGVEVRLYHDSNGNGLLDEGDLLYATTSTDAAGQYLFEGLPTTTVNNANKFIVQVVEDDPEVQEGLEVRSNDLAADTAVENATQLLTKDFQFSAVELLAKSVDKDQADVGQTVTYTLVPNYSGNELLTNVEITDNVPDGSTYVNPSSDPVADSQPGHGGTGEIRWSIGSNAAGVDGLTSGGTPGSCTITMKDTGTADQDTRIEDGKNSDKNYGDDNELKAKNDSKRILLQFDLAQNCDGGGTLPTAGVTVTSAALSLYQTDNKDNNKTADLIIHEITQSWNELEVTWDDNLTFDSVSSVADPVSVTYLVNQYNDIALNATGRGLLEDWLTGAAANNGFLIRGEGGDEVKFGSREVADEEPMLKVDYEISGVPTRSSFTVSRSLVGCDDSVAVCSVPVTVTLTFENNGDTDLDGVTPPASLVICGGAACPGGATATQTSGPTPTGPLTLGGGASQAFTYTYDLAPGTDFGSVQFAGTMAATGETFSEASSNSVLVSPAILFDVTATGTVDPFTNVAHIREGGAAVITDPAGNLCYAVADNGDAASADWFYSFDDGTDDFAAIASTGSFDVEAITFDAGGATLYAADGGDWGTIDVGTGAFTLIGSFGSGSGLLGAVTFDDVDGLTEDPLSGRYYATQRRPGANDLLFEVDPDTGEAVQNGFGIDIDYIEILSQAAVGQQDIDDIAADPGTGVLYAIASGGIGGAGDTDHLVTINPANGVVTDLGPLTNSVGGGAVADMEGLSFFGTQLVGTTGDAGADPNRYWHIDKATAVATVQGGAASPDTDFEALACPTVRSGAAPIIDADSNEVETAILASIGDTVFADLDGDGRGPNHPTDPDTNEPGLAGVTVYLCDDDPSLPTFCDARNADATTITDAEGNYRFYGLDPGTYRVTVDIETAPDGTFPTSATSITTTLIAGEQYDDADFGFQPEGTVTNANSIGDTVWLDIDEDGIGPDHPTTPDTNEPGIAGVTVELIACGATCGDGDDYVAQTTITDENGSYLFDGLPDGNYQVQVVESSTIATPQGGTTTLTDAMDLVSGTSPTGTISVTGGQDYTDADFGYNWSGSIGNYLWYDSNGDGIPDNTVSGTADEGGAAATVLLYNDDGSVPGELDPDDTVYATYLEADVNLGVVSDSDADSGGIYSYQFDNVPPGDYIVKVEEQQVVAPPSSPNAGQNGTMVTTTGSTHFLTLDPAEAYVDADFGFIEAAEVEGHVYHDANRSQQLEAGETRIGDSDPMAGVLVTLTGINIFGEEVTETTYTDENGEYKFIVPAGDYTISYDPADTFITSNYPNLTDTTTPTSVSFTAEAGVEYGGPAFDFGLDDAGAIGDFVFLDPNDQGTHQPGEPGIEGVTLELYADDGAGNPADAGDGVLSAAELAAGALQVTSTDINGEYLFEGLPDGFYVVVVDESTLDPAFDWHQTADPENDGSPPSCEGLPDCDGQGAAEISGGNTIDTVDFGYDHDDVDQYSVNGTIWDDADGDGKYDWCLKDGLVDVDCNGSIDVGGTLDDLVLENVAIVDGRLDLDKDGDFDTFTWFGYSVIDGYVDFDNDLVAGPNDLNGGEDHSENEGPIENVSLIAFEDNNGNGQHDPGEPVLGTPVTDPNGEWSVVGITAGTNVTVVVDDTGGVIPATYQQTGDPSVGQAGTTCIICDETWVYNNLMSDQYYVDFGYQDQPGSISGTVVYGAVDGDGLAEPGAGETVLAGVEVTLVNVDTGETVGTTTTNGSGYYSFTNLGPANYQVVLTEPAGIEAIADADGPNTTIATGNPALVEVTLAAGQDVIDQDFELTLNSIIAVNDDNNTLANFPVGGSVTFNDFDPDGNSVVFSGFQVPGANEGTYQASGTFAAVPGVDADGNPVADAGSLTISDGTVDVDGDGNVDPAGSYWFEPADNFTGTVSITYELCDDVAAPLTACDTAELNITVTELYDPVDVTTNSVIANDDDNISYDVDGDGQGEPVSDNVLNNDSDPQGNPLDFQSFISQSTPAPISTGAILSGTDENGNAVANAGTLDFDGDGNYTFNPAPGFFGTVEVDYEVCDVVFTPNLVACTTATLTIVVSSDADEVLYDLGSVGDTTEVDNENDRPVAGDDHGSGMVDTVITGNVLDNDDVSNAGDTLGSPALVDGPDNGTLVLDPDDGSYTYTPDPGYVGPDQFTYEVCDDASPTSSCDRATVYLVVMPEMDFGDLTDVKLPGAASDVAYGVLDEQAARHFIVPDLRIGAIVDPEDNGQPTATASGDDSDAEGDDEDGATFFTVGADVDNPGVFDVDFGETASYTLGVQVFNSRGEDAVLVGYADWNCDGDFNDTDERRRAWVDGDGSGDDPGFGVEGGICTPAAGNVHYCQLRWGTLNGNTHLVSNAAYNACGTVGADKQTFARLRLTTEPEFFLGNSPKKNGRARNGEVEDYPIILASSSTPAVIGEVSAVAAADGGALVSWTTGAEMGAAAFRLERLVDDKHWKRVHQEAWIPALMEIQGGTYQVHDEDVTAGSTVAYRIVEQTIGGRNELYGPFEVTVAEGSAALAWADSGYAIQDSTDVERISRNLETREQAKRSKPGKGGGGGGGDGLLRMLVKQTGLHGLTLQELADAFEADTDLISSKLNGEDFSLHSGGMELPWYSDGSRLIFYGQAPESIYSTSRTYWLEMKKNGLVMEELPVGSGTASDQFFEEVLDIEEDHRQNLAGVTDPESDYWYWNFMYDRASDALCAAIGTCRTFVYDLEVPGAMPEAAELTIRFLGSSAGAHPVSISTEGGIDLGSLEFTGSGRFEETITIPAGVLSGDVLSLRLTAMSPASGINLLYVDGFEVRYTRAHVATDGRIPYPADGPTKVTGFASEDIVTIDVTDPQTPVWIDGGDVGADGASFAFMADLPNGEYVSSAGGALLKPVTLELAQARDLRAANNRADYVVITNAELMDAAEALAEYRSDSMQTMVLDVQEIYDNFSDGEPVPTAMQDFARASQEWRTAPRFFAILGDGSYDYRDILGTGFNFVAPQMFVGATILFASDTLMGDIDGDGKPEVQFGRIPIKSVTEGFDYIDKLAAFEAGVGSLPSLLLSDNPDKGGQFDHSTRRIEQEMDGITIPLSLGESTKDVVRSELQSELNSGLKLINFLGHGGMDRVAAEGLILKADVASMNNDVTPTFVGLSCLINNYSIPTSDGLGEMMVLKPGGGIVASWAASGESFNDQATEIGLEFHRISGGHERLGDAIIATFQARPYLVPVYTLIGDPALLIQ